MLEKTSAVEWAQASSEKKMFDKEKASDSYNSKIIISL